MPDKLKCLAITSRGIEDVAGSEIKEIIGKECEIRDSCVLFTAGNIRDLCLVSYKSQSIDKTILLIFDSDFCSFDDLVGKIRNMGIKKSIVKDFSAKTFVVRCRREGEHGFSSVDVEKEVGKLMEKSLDMKPDFKAPELIFYCYVNANYFYLGIDFSGIELQKRQYKIYAQPSSLRATLAYALVRLSGYKKNEALLDPFAGDGVIIIEAALHSSGFSPNYYSKDKFSFMRFGFLGDIRKFLEKQDKKPSIKGQLLGFDSMFKYVDYARKNAKIAGVHDLISLSRADMDWLDVKLKEKSIGRIATKLPSSIKAGNDKLLDALFYQAEYVLKDKGALALITYYPEIVKECASRRNFILAHERKVWSGKQELGILIFNKAKK